MKEKLYAIPVNDAFDIVSECPICEMYNKLETEAVDFTMGTSYMVDDVRMETDKKGFCTRHLKMVYDKENRLGMALVVNTYLNKFNKEIKQLIDKSSVPSKPSLFSKSKDNDSEIIKYISDVQKRCFVCDRINDTFERYVATIMHLYKTDPLFVQKYKSSNGFCIGHYKILLEMAPQLLKGDVLADFYITTNSLFINNMERVNDDVAWFAAKFDYRNQDAPWKNSKDSLPRSVTKLNK